MKELLEFEETIDDLRRGLSQARYTRDTPQRRTWARHSGWASVTAACLILTSLLLPSAGNGIAWAAVARPLTPSELAWITDDCSQVVADYPADGPQQLPPLIASEMRGDLATLTFAGNGWFTTCVVEDMNRDDEVAPFVSTVQWSSVDELSEGDDTMRFSTLGLAPDPIDGPAGMEATTFITGTLTERVSRVVIEVPELGELEATVENGWFTAWWPSRAPFVIRGLGTTGELVAEFTIN